VIATINYSASVQPFHDVDRRSSGYNRGVLRAAATKSIWRGIRSLLLHVGLSFQQ
jgi:hypothetical protein